MKKTLELKVGITKIVHPLLFWNDYIENIIMFEDV
jgi:hypothetical protein